MIAIHWRTEETRANLSMFARAAADPATAPSVEEFYLRDCTEQFGPEAGPQVANILTRMDREQTLQTVSPEYYCYEPSWGRLSPELRGRLAEHRDELKALVDSSPNRRNQANLQWLADNFEFTLLLDEVSRQLEPAYKLKERWLLGKVPPRKAGHRTSPWHREALAKAPIEQLFRTYARRVRSKGELGELSSLNQKLWLQYRELDQFLKDAGK